MNPEEFKAQLASMGIKLSDKQMQQFATYYQMLVEANKHVNLTTIVDEKDVYLKHFYDSITPVFYDQSLKTEALTLCDVGAGAGFPSLPMKIVFPNLKVTIVDSLNKRITFLQNLVDALGLDGVELYHARAEEFGGKKSKHREQYDVATARAVARMSVLSELCLPLVKVGGKMIALKAAQAETELANGNQAIKTLGGQVVADEEFSLPVSDDQRHIIILDKTKKTPKQYPRKAGTPNKKPIGEPEK
ncbi:16S rRNA (guanine(527)-N(7))-methyltransferase RsmG [Apilactobacillus micheneri]|uniref:Ribosomal RNA small subunit methyltransferase G n=1 Tax=Apilactobacillus micheneri TaxID=1899430 RepID=A0ABY2YXU2_9LACO|nr:16S rRNA (guanine(527)-N(7))-methyltransferase RsmG [Apilactobacillus micheneri]TPR26135.1 16S rRNA (guanine(527)-N(7))-methyltransferase RsmG [Apilactobacillus micheneri]TPR26889.1 16S rRNA (guanine(527)-N(7))-methyltransferase RsmG [Apilactobacillus micheneri]TPR27747.1 16S rRNA (guanine(527)-N(7))-methyltransferase RsmG [Apilactobacillus micheneri]TPR31652.1 16S rRNA (guanine(527)-N(7))-methyltransferase RsmG [Apilactobacillus micheneri]TPR32056.1 16S rRNA (guanine(527)-N(7))-methyltrans